MSKVDWKAMYLAEVKARKAVEKDARSAFFDLFAISSHIRDCDYGCAKDRAVFGYQQLIKYREAK